MQPTIDERAQSIVPLQNIVQCPCQRTSLFDAFRYKNINGSDNDLRPGFPCRTFCLNEISDQTFVRALRCRKTIARLVTDRSAGHKITG